MRRFAILVGALLLPSAALAEVRESSPSGFVIQIGLDVPADPQAAWDALIAPRK